MRRGAPRGAAPLPLLSAAAAATNVALTIVGWKTRDTEIPNYTFAAVFFVALIGIAAGIAAAVATRARGQARAPGWLWAGLNVLVGLIGAGVFVAVAISNSE